MNIYRATVKWYYEDEEKVLNDLILVPGNNYSDAAGQIEDNYRKDLIEFSIMEMEAPINIDKDFLDECEEVIAGKE